MCVCVCVRACVRACVRVCVRLEGHSATVNRWTNAVPMDPHTGMCLHSTGGTFETEKSKHANKLNGRAIFHPTPHPGPEFSPHASVNHFTKSYFVGTQVYSQDLHRGNEHVTQVTSSSGRARANGGSKIFGVKERERVRGQS